MRPSIFEMKSNETFDDLKFANALERHQLDQLFVKRVSGGKRMLLS